MSFEECEVSFGHRQRDSIVCVYDLSLGPPGQRAVGEGASHCEILVGNSVNHQITIYLNKGHIVGETGPTADGTDGRSDSV